MTSLRAGSATDVGMVRATNQDQFLVSTPLFAVADGMGGHAAGEVASKVAVDTLGASFHGGPSTPAGLAEAAHAANRQVWEHAQTDPDLRGMGTTLVAIALVDGDNGAEQLAIANVGDSRAYRLHDEALEQVTVDHSLVQELIDEGQIDEEEAAIHPQRHVLTRALGVDPDVAVDLILLPPRPGDRFLLCSDGLIREVGDDLVASVLRRESDPDTAAAELVGLAREHGGSDNITVVVVDIVDEPAGATNTVELPEGPPQPSGAAEEGNDRNGATVPPDTDETVEAVAASAADTVEAGTAAGEPPEAGSDAPAEDDADPPPDDGPEDDGGAGTNTATAAASSGPGPGGRRHRALTVRVVLFVTVFVVLLGIAAAAVGWYARDNYFVGLQGDQLVIFQGRPGGVLWFNPTVARATGVRLNQVLPAALPDLQAGKQTGSLASARAYVANLQSEWRNATTTTTTTTSTTSTTTTTTTRPRTTTTHSAAATTTRPTTARPATAQAAAG